jgi:uncharacterized protein
LPLLSATGRDQQAASEKFSTKEETSMLAPGRAKPKPTPETRHFWDGTKDGKLLLQRCGDTGKAYFPPRPFSPYTGTRNVTVFEA